MKKFSLVFIFVLSTGFLMAQFTKTFNEEDGSTRTITVTTDKELRKVYSEEVRDKNNKLTSKTIYKKDLLERWEVTTYKTQRDRGETEYEVQHICFFDEKGVFYRQISYEDGKLIDGRRNSTGTIGRISGDRVLKETVVMEEDIHGPTVRWLDKLDENTVSPPKPSIREMIEESRKRKKKCKETKVSIYIGPSLLNGDSGSSRESFFGGQAYALFNINSNIGVGADFSLNTKKDGDQKITQSLVLARGQYNFFTGDGCNKKVIPEAHVLFGLGLDSFKYTYDGNTSKSSGNGPAYGVGAGVAINISPNINIGISVDYIGVKYENSNSSNSNIRGSAGIIFGI